MKKDWLTYTWLPASEAARLEGVDERTIRNRCRQGMNGGYVWRLNSSSEKEIRLSSLSGDAIGRWEEEELPEFRPAKSRENPESFRLLFEASSSHTQKKCLQWTEVLLEVGNMRGTANLRGFVRWWNKEREFKISYSRLYAVRLELMRNGGDRSFLLKERRIPQSTVKKEWMHDFKQLYMRQQRPSANDCRIYALGKARERGENVALDSFPSLASFYRCAEKIGDGIKTWHRAGPKGHYDACSLFIERDYSKVQAGWCWVGDTRTWDVLVNCPGFDAPKRPYITMFLDLRTDMPMGWHIHFTPPSAANALTALRNGIKHRGKPDMLYVDNGREFRNKDFSGNPRGGNNWGSENGEDGDYWMRSAASVLNIQMKFAIAKNSRAKTVENFFGVCKKIIDKSFLSYFGGNSVERPEQVKDLYKNKDKIISFAEFKHVMDRNFLNIIPAYPCKLKRFEQGTRGEAWSYLYAQRERMEEISADALDMIPTLTEDCAIGRNGATIAKLGASWWAEWMSPLKGEKITVRYNPQDLSKAWGYDAQKGILGEMGKPHVVPAMIEALPEDERELSRANLAEAMAAQRKERRQMREAHKSEGISEHDILQAREFALGVKTLDAATGEVVDNGAKIAPVPAVAVATTKHDKDMEKLKRQSKYGDPELLNMLG
jgi:transposase InsO family protein